MAGRVGGGEGDFGLQIAPMLDVLFVLLLFFMVSAGAVKHEAGITTQLPGNGQPGKSMILQVAIDSNGQVSINNAPYDTTEGHNLPETKAKLAAIVKSNPDQAIIVAPMGTTKQQRVVDVLNACSAAGVKNLAFGSP